MGVYLTRLDSRGRKGLGLGYKDGMGWDGSVKGFTWRIQEHVEICLLDWRIEKSMNEWMAGGKLEKLGCLLGEGWNGCG